MTKNTLLNISQVKTKDLEIHTNMCISYSFPIHLQVENKLELDVSIFRLERNS